MLILTHNVTFTHLSSFANFATSNHGLPGIYQNYTRAYTVKRLRGKNVLQTNVYVRPHLNIQKAIVSEMLRLGGGNCYSSLKSSLRLHNFLDFNFPIIGFNCCLVWAVKCKALKNDCFYSRSQDQTMEAVVGRGEGG